MGGGGFLRKAKAAAIVCDLTRDGTLAAVRQWKRELDQWAAGEVRAAKPFMLVALVSVVE
jgi:hypothetical protein